MLRGLLASAVKITPIKIFWKTVPPWVLITLYGYCLCLLSGIVFVGVSVEISLILSIVTFLLLLNLWNQVEIFYAIRFQHLVLSTSSNPCFISFTFTLTYLYIFYYIEVITVLKCTWRVFLRVIYLQEKQPLYVFARPRVIVHLHSSNRQRVLKASANCIGYLSIMARNKWHGLNPFKRSRVVSRRRSN